MVPRQAIRDLTGTSSSVGDLVQGQVGGKVVVPSCVGKDGRLFMNVAASAEAVGDVVMQVESGGSAEGVVNRMYMEPTALHEGWRARHCGPRPRSRCDAAKPTKLR